jgi:hypothetical protein
MGLGVAAGLIEPDHSHPGEWRLQAMMFLISHGKLSSGFDAHLDISNLT